MNTSVLLVEPDRDNREMYAEWLHFDGFDVLTTDNGVDALRIAPRADVIITAVRLLGPIDGAQFTETVRATCARKVILLMTACGLGTEGTRARRAGADAVLLKPCLPEALSAEIRRVLVSATTRR